MVSKYVYLLDDTEISGPEPTLDTTDLSKDLQDHKMKIGEFYTNKKWDKFKKQTNFFELIFTTGHHLPSLSSYLPISRSFFKHWEILHDFKDALAFPATGMRIACLAEGPGGFIESFVHYRKQNTDKIFGVTLISSDRCVPMWKLSKSMIEKANITLLYGKDKTGSLYKKENVDDYVEKIGPASCDYITADGGFDFSNNFDNQEEISMQLISSEIYTALRLQKKGGAFLLKIYDINLLSTKKLLWILKQNYETLNFIKPLTSRPANSEKYILCIGFRGPSSSAPTKDLTPSFLQKINEFNTVYMIRQIVNINLSLISINCNQNHNETLKVQIEKGLKWLHKYNIPVNKESLLYYKKAMTNQIKDKNT